MFYILVDGKLILQLLKLEILMFSRVLVVCVGNICRSPTGKYLLRQLKPNLIIDSAGVGALVGKNADSMAFEVAKENNLDLSKHKAQQLTREMCSQYDLILVMEKKHIASVSNIAPEARGKTMLFGQWLDQKEIPDPYRQSKEAFEFTYQLLSDSANAWAKHL